MIVALSLIGLLYFSGLLLVIFASRNAKKGYEDEAGFHYEHEGFPVVKENRRFVWSPEQTASFKNGQLFRRV